MKIEIVNQSANPLPTSKHKGDSGLDLRANLHSDLILKVGERVKIGTGLYMKFDAGYELQIRNRSGLSIKGFDIVFGTIDSSYRGEIKVICINNTGSEYTVRHGERIAQGVFAKVEEEIEFEQVDTLEESLRGANGFGSTGI